MTLPHDAMIHRERKPDAPSGSAQAYFPGGKYAYEKRFQRPDAYLVDGENIIRVECENVNQPDSRWYSGAGIYRPVWLWTGDGAAIEPESVRVSTVSVDPAVIRVQSDCFETAHIEILKDGKTVAEGDGNDLRLTILDAKLWSTETPELYTCVASLPTDAHTFTFGIRQITRDQEGLKVNGKKVLLRGGCVHQDSGIVGAATYDELEWRQVRMMKEAGFNAIRSAHNPANRALLDACDALGMYVMDEGWDMWYNRKNPHDYATRWRETWQGDLKAMVSRDFNHPCVIMYSIGNEVSEPAQDEGVRHTRMMVDFLHELDGNRLVTAGFNLMIIKSASKGKGVYKEDGSGRDDSADKKMGGMNSTMFNLITNIVGTGMNKAANGKAADEVTSPSLDLLDVAGYNYASGRYPKEGQLHPDRLVVGSETFPQDIVKNWRMVERYPWLCGDFMWTAWDYLGEVGLGAWAYDADGKGFNKPYSWLLADSGAMDILGNPNGELFLAQTVWHVGKPVRVAVQPVNYPGVKPAKAVWRGTNAIPSWSWKGCERNGSNISLRLDEDEVKEYLDTDAVLRTIPTGFAAPELEGKYFLVTGTGKYFKNVQYAPEVNLGIVRLTDGGATAQLLWGYADGGQFTSEFPAHMMSHVARLTVNPDSRVVMHCHPANLLAKTYVHSLDEREFTRTLWQMCTECIVVFPDGVNVLPWMLCGTNAIGEATAEKMKTARLVVWSLHGIYGAGRDLDETFGLIETAEKAAEIYMKITHLPRLNTITDEQMHLLEECFGVKGRAGYLD